MRSGTSITTDAHPIEYTAISRKVVGKSARDNPERHCGWFWIHCSSEKFERIGSKGSENVFASANGKQQKQVRQPQSPGTVYLSYPILPSGIVACTFFLTTFLEIAVYNSNAPLTRFTG